MEADWGEGGGVSTMYTTSTADVVIGVDCMLLPLSYHSKQRPTDYPPKKTSSDDRRDSQ